MTRHVTRPTLVIPAQGPYPATFSRSQLRNPGTGADNTTALYSAAGFFEALPSAYGLEFGRRFTSRFGAEAPMLNSLGESCYEGVKLLAALVSAARSTSVPELSAVADTVSYEGARGLLHVHDHHLDQPVYLSAADGLEFDVLAQLEPPSTATR